MTDEPMYLISESRIKKVLELDRGAYNRSDEIEDLLRANKYERARGPVSAQQQAPVIFEGQSRFACPFQNGCEDGDGFCEYPCEKWLDWHDAAIAAAERERVLDDVAQYIEKHTHCCSQMPLWVVTKEPLIEFLQSLRSQPEKQQEPDYNELRMIEALEHVASTESWTAMNAFIAECRKQYELRQRGRS